jgi:hypothetical protein
VAGPFIAGALRPAPAQSDNRTATSAPVHAAGAVEAPAPVHRRHRSDSEHSSIPPAPAAARTRRSDAEDLAELRRVSDAEHDGAPLGQREITRVLNCGFPKARRLAELAGWVEPPAEPAAPSDDASGEIPGQLQLTDEPGQTPAESPTTATRTAQPTTNSN